MRRDLISGVEFFEGTRTTTTPDRVEVEFLEARYSSVDDGKGGTKRIQRWIPDPTKSVELSKAGDLPLDPPCQTANAKLGKLTAEEQDLWDDRVKLALRITELEEGIAAAKAWTGMARIYLWSYGGKNPETGETIWNCDFCRGPEKSIVNRFSRYAFVEGKYYHVTPPPYVVEEVRFLYEERVRRRAKDSRIEGLLRGSPLSIVPYTFYTDWGLRDYYLELEEPRLKRRLDQLASIDAQLAELRERLQKAREEKKQLCEQPTRRLPLDLIATEPAIDPKSQPVQSGGAAMVVELSAKLFASKNACGINGNA